MTNAPVFNLSANNIDITDEALQEELAKTGGKWFDDAGNYDLTITAADFHVGKETKTIYCPGDSTWVNVKVTLSLDDKSVDTWIQVPTTSLSFGEKKTFGPYRKFQQFMFGIGEAPTTATIQKLLMKYFAKPSVLVGMKVNVDLGYEGAYVAKVADSDEYNVIIKGSPMKEDGVEVRLPDRSSAIQFAKSKGIAPSHLSVRKFTAKKAKAAPKAVANSDW